MTNNGEITFVKIILPLSTGIYLTYLVADKSYIQWFMLITFSLLMMLVGIGYYYKTFLAYRFKTLTGILFLLFFFNFGALIGLLKKDVLKASHFTKCDGKYLKVWINDEPQIGKSTIRFIATVIGSYKNNKLQRTTGNLLIVLKADPLIPIRYHYGDELIIHADYTLVAPPYNPGEFDFREWLASKNVYHQTFINENEVIKTRFNTGNPIIKYALKLRKEQVDYYSRTIKNKEAFSVASTLILGYRADLSEDTLSIYSKTGTIHALSVSGMHVGIIYIVLNWALSFLDGRPTFRLVKIILIIFFIWFYSLLTGFSPSILRSAIMLTVYILAKSISRQANAYNVLAFTAFCLLSYNPYFLFDVGFQLSFLAVLGLIYLHPKIYQLLYFKQRWVDWLWSSTALSIAAQISTFPLSIYYFHQFPVYFLLSNLFILLPITLLMYLGITILLFKLSFLTTSLAWLILFMNGGLDWIANLPFAGITGIWLNQLEFLMISSVILLGIFALDWKSKYALITTFLLFLCFVFSIAYSGLLLKNQQLILFFTLNKGYAAAFINRQKAIIVTNLLVGDKDFKFFIQPALDQLQIESQHVINWETDFHHHSFSKKHHQIQFINYRLLMVDSCFNRKTIEETASYDLVWIHQNPKIKLADLRQTILFKELVLDASNNTFSLEQYVDEANKIKVQAHVLKKNKAYLVHLNHRQ